MPRIFPYGDSPIARMAADYAADGRATESELRSLQKAMRPALGPDSNDAARDIFRRDAAKVVTAFLLGVDPPDRSMALGDMVETLRGVSPVGAPVAQAKTPRVPVGPWSVHMDDAASGSTPLHLTVAELAKAGIFSEDVASLLPKVMSRDGAVLDDQAMRWYSEAQQEALREASEKLQGLQHVPHRVVRIDLPETQPFDLGHGLDLRVTRSISILPDLGSMSAQIDFSVIVPPGRSVLRSDGQGTEVLCGPGPVAIKPTHQRPVALTVIGDGAVLGRIELPGLAAASGSAPNLGSVARAYASHDTVKPVLPSGLYAIAGLRDALRVLSDGRVAVGEQIIPHESDSPNAREHSLYQWNNDGDAMQIRVSNGYSDPGYWTRVDLARRLA